MASHVRHIYALGAATLSRHLRYRSILLRLLRICLPLAVLPALRSAGRIEGLLKDAGFLQKLGLSKLDARNLAKNIEAFGLQIYISAGTDAAFVSALLGIMLVMLVLFVQHLTAESESGLRRLLHTMGLSRYAYWLTVAGLEGMLQTLTDMLIILLGARFWLGLRMASDTSLTLCIAAVLLLAASGITVASLLHMLVRTAKGTTLVTMFVALLLFGSSLWSSASAVAYSQDLLQAGGGRWAYLLLCPVLPSFHILALCAKACHQGRCIVLTEVPSFLRERQRPPVSAMINILIDAEGEPARRQAGRAGDLEEVADLAELVASQLLVLAVVILVCDALLLPPIRKGWSAGSEQDPPGLQATGLTHSYGWGGSPALDGVTFSISPGPNGAGKTTTIRCITGEETQQGGSIAYRPSAVAYTTDSYVGLCPQETVLVPDLSVEEHLRFFARVKALPESKLRTAVERMLEATKLLEKRHEFPSKLSGGMQRRLAIGTALIGCSAMSLLDEPTTGLDPVSRRSIWELIGAVKDEGTCILLTTHMLEEAEELCSNIVILMKGKVSIQGTVQELKTTWGSGYNLTVDTMAGQKDKVRSYVASLLPAELQAPVKMAQGKFVFKVGHDAQFVGRLFIQLAEGAASNGIRNWGISQASLEEAYVRILQSES